ncbi:hypothetical protein ACTHQ1_10590 [Janibacter anophelis]|uniref:hypothetical protein n=1 Tax=Janibacter anophelis TaxID=319054 RepID=UPI003F7CE556
MASRTLLTHELAAGAAALVEVPDVLLEALRLLEDEDEVEDEVADEAVAEVEVLAAELLDEPSESAPQPTRARTARPAAARVS